METLDLKSIGLCLITYFGLVLSKSDVIFGITVGVGLSTMLYNVIKIIKTLKDKA